MPAAPATPPAGSPPAYPPSPGYGQPGAPPPTFMGSAPPNAWNPAPVMVAAPRPMNWDAFAFVFRFVGFLLAGIGAILAAAWASVPGGCYTTGATCGATSSFIQGAANALLAGWVLLALGALLIGLGAGVKLHWVLRPPTEEGHPERWGWLLVERVMNYAFIAGAVVIFWLVLKHFGTATIEFS